MTSVKSVEYLKKLQNGESTGGGFVVAEDVDMTKDGSIFNKVSSSSQSSSASEESSSPKKKGLIAQAKELIGGIAGHKSKASSAQNGLKSKVSAMTQSVSQSQNGLNELNSFGRMSMQTINDAQGQMTSLGAENENVDMELTSLQGQLDAEPVGNGANPFASSQNEAPTSLLSTPGNATATVGATSKTTNIQAQIDALTTKKSYNSVKIAGFKNKISTTYSKLKVKTESLISKIKASGQKAKAAAEKAKKAQAIGSAVSTSGALASSVGSIVIAMPDPTFISKPLAGKLILGGAALSFAGSATSKLGDTSSSDSEKAMGIVNGLGTSAMQAAGAWKNIKTPTTTV